MGLRVEYYLLFQIPQRYRFSSKSQLNTGGLSGGVGCFRYHKGTDFQANHNDCKVIEREIELFQIPQRYRFSSKSQRDSKTTYRDRSCFRYHKGTDFQANHNLIRCGKRGKNVVLDTTKVQIFKQITTHAKQIHACQQLFQIPQRYRFSSKSQLKVMLMITSLCCFRYHKGTDFQANHNGSLEINR